jgi:uncharacterized lipoprotein YddW (UPF0748 family)
MIRSTLRRLLFSLAALAIWAGAPTSARAEERILWYSIGDGLTNSTNLQAAIDFAVANKYNAICVLARYRANAYYIPNRDFSTFANPEPQSSGAAGDTLQYAIDHGHEAGLRVYAAFGCFLVTDNSNTLPAQISTDWITYLYQDVTAPNATNDTTYSPDAGFPRKMVAADSDGLWVDPGVTAVRDFTRNVMKDMVQNYDVDGVILDRIRYPGDGIPHRNRAFGYNPTALSNMGAGATPAPGSTAFITARRNAITAFVTSGAADLHALKPWVIYGSAPIAYGSTLSDTYSTVFQHFPSWNSAANPNHVSGLGNQDFIAPQYYRTNSASNQTLMNLVAADITESNRIFHQATFWVSSGAAIVAQGICDTRSVGGMSGFGLFSYTGSKNNSFMSTLNATNTTGCGTGVMNAVSPQTNFTLKKNWDAVKPNNITDLTARASSTGQIILTWNTPSAASDGDRPARYLVYRSASANVKPYYANLVNRTADVTGNSFVDSSATGLTAGKKYYRVVPVDDYNNKGTSNEVNATPGGSTVIVESRTSGGGVTAAPAYAETGSFSSTTSKSSAAGLVGSGSRYSTTINNSVTFKPAIASSGFYDVFVTLDDAGSGGNNNALADFTITGESGATVTGSVRLSPATTGLANAWMPIATNVKFAAGQTGSITFLNKDGNAGTGARFCADAIKVEGTTGLTAEWDRDDFASGGLVPPGSANGWSSYGYENSLASSSYSDGAYKAHIYPTAQPAFRISGVISNQSEWLPYAVVGTTYCARAKFWVYAGGQSTPGQSNLIPNMRVRLSSQFAVNSMLEVFSHLNGDPVQNSLSQDIRPSSDPSKPSLYRVDIDPVDVPYLRDNPSTTGFLRAFESLSTDPQDNGYLALTESSVSVYPISARTATVPVKVYAPTASDAGNMRLYNAFESILYRLVMGPNPGDPSTAEYTSPLPTDTEGSFGVRLDSSTVVAGQIGIANRNFNPDGGTNNQASRIRVEPNKQYRARFHLTSTQNTNAQAQIRMRAFTVKFGWAQKMELGGAWATDFAKTYPLDTNNRIAQEALPGVGSLNPDKIGTENGSWYTLLMHTPLSMDVRPDVAGATLTQRMPNLSAQPAQGVNQPSSRDLLLGIDLLDSISLGVGAPMEQGNVTVDRIEVYVDDLVPD